MRDRSFGAVAVGLGTLIAVTMALALAARAGNAPPTGDLETAARQTLYVAPGGEGPCSRQAPCASFGEAVRRGKPGARVLVAAGHYPQQKIPRAWWPEPSRRLLITPDPPTARVEVDGLVIEQGGLTIRGVTSRESVVVRRAATGTRLESIRVTGDTGSRDSVYLAADGSELVGSLIEDGEDDDLVKVAASNVLIEGNKLGPARRGVAAGHVDCVQVMAGAEIVIRGNVMWGCSNAALLIKPDQGPITDMLVENNFMQGCPERTETCAGHYALYVRHAPRWPVQSVRLVHNSVDGAISVDASIPELTLVGNIFGRLDNCGPLAADNLIGASTCRTREGLTLGTATFEDPDQADLHLRPRSRGIDAGKPEYAPATDIDGEPRQCGPPDLGADEHCE